MGTDNNNRPARIVNTLAKQILPETPLLAFEHIRQGLERPLVSSGNNPAAPAIVEQDINSLLQHPLLITNNNIGCVKFQQTFESVITINNPSVEVIQIGGGKTAAFKWNKRAKIRGKNRYNLKDHPFRLIARVPECLNNKESLTKFLPFGLRVGVGHFIAQSL